MRLCKREKKNLPIKFFVFYYFSNLHFINEEPSSKGYSLKNEVSLLGIKGNCIYLKLIRVAAWETTVLSSLKIDLITAVPIKFSHGRDIIFSLESPLLPSEIGCLLRKGLDPLSVLVNFGGRGPLYRRSAEVNNVSEAVPWVDSPAAHYKSDPTGTLPTPFWVLIFSFHFLDKTWLPEFPKFVINRWRTLDDWHISHVDILWPQGTGDTVQQVMWYDRLCLRPIWTHTYIPLHEHISLLWQTSLTLSFLSTKMSVLY